MDHQMIRFDRLRTLVHFLNKLDPEQMDMDVVVSNKADIDFDQIKAGTSHACGAIGCAIGWAGLMPEFRNEGLKYTRKGTLKLNGASVTFDVAGVDFFGLTQRQSMWLFGPLRHDENDSQQAFMLRIRALSAIFDEEL